MFHATFIENPSLILKYCLPLNPTTLLPSTKPLTHSCKETLQELSCQDPFISSNPLHESTLTWFVNSSLSLTPAGFHRAGYAIVSLTGTIESGPPPPRTTFQKAKLKAITATLTLAQGQRVNNFIDSKYTYYVLYHHTIVWKERGILTTKETLITNSPLIIRLLENSYLLAKAAVVHCRHHHPISDPIAMGNVLAGQAAKEASRVPFQVSTISFLALANMTPSQSTNQCDTLLGLGASPGLNDWLFLKDRYCLPEDRLCLP